MTLEEFAVNFEKRSIAEMNRRAEAAMLFLLGAIQEAYYDKLIGSRGGAGAVGALSSKVQFATSFIVGVIGFGKSGDYLKYLEYGIAPAAGAKYEAYSTVPPPTAIAEWIKRSRLPIPDKFKPLNLRSRDRVRALKKLSRGAGEATKRYARIASATITSRAAKRARAVDSQKGTLEERARLRWAWAIAIKRKKFGYKGLRIIERVAKQVEHEIIAILEAES